MTLTIYDVVTAGEVATYWNTFQEDLKPMLGEVLFPAKKQIGLDFSFIKGAGGLPVALKASAWDVETPLRDRIGFTELQGELPFFKEGYIVKEKDRQEINRVLASNQKAYADIMLENIYNDSANLIKGAKVQNERMRMQLLSQGFIEVMIDGTPKVYDYAMPGDNKVTLTEDDRWDNPDADIISDLEDFKKHMRRTQGVEVTRGILTDATLNLMKRNNVIKSELIRPDAPQRRILDRDVLDYISSMLGITFQVYNEMYIDEQGETKQFFPDGVITLLPEGTVGNTLFGTTPEEADLMVGIAKAEVAIVETGVAITTAQKADPVNTLTKASMVSMPTGEMIDKVFIAEVALPKEEETEKPSLPEETK